MVTWELGIILKDLYQIVLVSKIGGQTKPKSKKISLVSRNTQ
jgi:hypothetical protein